MNRSWAWAPWIVLLLIWTALLWTPSERLGPSPLPSIIPVGKILHVVMYAGLAAGVGWLPVSLTGRRIVLAGLMLHGALTEAGQLWVPGRDGSLKDVALDTVSIAAGWWLARRWWPADSGCT
jgi:VanZ family protein